MSIRIMSQVWEHSAVTDTNELVVLLAIADWADDEGIAYPKVAKLAKKARLSDREVQRCVANLKAMGELQVEQNAGPKMANLYRVVTNGDRPSPVVTDVAPSDTQAMVTGPSPLNGDQREPASGTVSPEPSKSNESVTDVTVDGDRPSPSGKKKGNARVQGFYDGMKEHQTCCQFQWSVSAPDRAALIHSTAPPGDIAKAFVDLMDPHRGWGDRWLQQNKAIWAVVRNMNAWYASESNQDQAAYMAKGRMIRNY